MVRLETGQQYRFCESSTGKFYRILHPAGASEAIGLQLTKELCCDRRITFPLKAGWRIWQAVKGRWLEVGFQRTPVQV